MRDFLASHSAEEFDFLQTGPGMLAATIQKLLMMGVVNNLTTDPVNPLKGKRGGFGSIVYTCMNGETGFKDSA